MGIPLYEEGAVCQITNFEKITILACSPTVDNMYMEYIYFLEIEDGDRKTYETIPETEVQIMFRGVNEGA